VGVRDVLSLCPAILLSLGCFAAGPPGPATIGPRPSCSLGATSATPAESIAVAASSAIDAAHAPEPTTSAERFAFAQTYETLINVDCEGHAYPGLARSWTTDATKTRVTLLLRDDARFWSGEPVAARDIVAAWQSTGRRSTSWGQLVRRLAEAATIVDDRTLIVSLPDTEWLALAEPALAVYRPSAGPPWPEGTGPYRPVESVTGAAPATLTLMPVAPGAPRLVIRSVRDDARDAIDAGVDLLLTADPVAVRYAATRSDLTTIALPWSRTFALAAPRRTPGVLTEVLSSAGDSAALRASLARDAVRAEARGTESTGWWSEISQNCESSHPNGAAPPDAGPGSRRIVYRADDPVARALAERLVAIGRRATAAPLAPADFERALRIGGELAYVVSLPRAPLTPCRELTALLLSAPWLANGGRLDGLLFPLVDMRERAVVKRDHASAIIEWDGTLRIRAESGRR